MIARWPSGNVLPCARKLSCKLAARNLQAHAYVHPWILAEGIHNAATVNTDAHVEGVIIGGIVGWEHEPRPAN